MIEMWWHRYDMHDVGSLPIRLREQLAWGTFDNGARSVSEVDTIRHVLTFTTSSTTLA